jgi:hypothetical protein
MAEDKEKGKSLFINASEDLLAKDENNEMIVSMIQPVNQNETTLIYDSDVPAIDIVTDSSALTGVALGAEEVEILTETIERSKGFGAGFEFEFGFPEIATFRVKKLPQKEVRTIKKAKYRKIK